MMSLPSGFEIPICVAAVKIGALDWSGWPEIERKRMTAAKSDHMIAFTACIGEANKVVRTDYEDELAQVISDHHCEMPEILRQALNRLQGRPFPVEIEVPREGREPECAILQVNQWVMTTCTR